MPEERFRCLAPSVVTVSWVEPDGTEQEDYAPLHEVWASGGQVHVDQPAQPGTKLRVIMEDGVELTGEVETCRADESFGYILDVTMTPQHVWLAGPHRQYFQHHQAFGLAKAS